ncbi:MAG TPA: alpha/beta hydrolase [Stellaceae bacterium]|nr:alpha/beta hydrolase [Stellaceae bacterium]
MSLSPDEYRLHLETTSVRAGFSFSEFVLPESHEVQVGAMRMHYLDWGNKHLPTILLLHGGALNAHTWDLVCLALRDEYHCIALDQRGHGDTDWAADGDYTMGAQLADTSGFVDALGLDKFILVGMSLGAINSICYAIAHPEKLAKLVIIDAGPEMRRPGSSRIRDFVNGVKDTVTIEGIIEKALEFNPRRDPNILRRSLMHALRQQPDGSWKWKYDRRRFEVLDQEAHRAERAKLADGLARITCPTLVVRGGESDVFHEEDAVHLAERLPDGRKVTIPRAGHTVQGDNPKDLVTELRAFLAKAN